MSVCTSVCDALVEMIFPHINLVDFLQILHVYWSVQNPRAFFRFYKIRFLVFVGGTKPFFFEGMKIKKMASVHQTYKRIPLKLSIQISLGNRY